MVRFLMFSALALAGVQGAKLHEPAPTDRVLRLLVDVNQTVVKAAHDADLVFATVASYDRQMLSSVKREVSVLDQTLVKLNSMQMQYSKQVNGSSAVLERLAADVAKSWQEAEAGKSADENNAHKAGELLSSVEKLVSMLQQGGVTLKGTLVTQEALDAHGEPGRVISAVRSILAASQDLQPRFKDVFQAFAPPSLAQLRGHTALAHKAVHMTPALLQRTVSALHVVSDRLKKQQAEALAQIDSQQQKAGNTVAATMAQENAARSSQADSMRKADELSFSLSFTKSVLKMDRDFAEALKIHAETKAKLVGEIHDTRARQQKTLRSLIDLLQGSYNVPAVEALSFVQSSSETIRLSELQTSVEQAIKGRKDTHGLLMQLKAQLDASEPVDPRNVQNVVKQMNEVLHSVEDEQDRADDVRRRCEAQRLHGDQEAKDLHAAASLVVADRTHTTEAVRAAESNLNGVAAKSKALTKSHNDFDKTSLEAVRTLEGQGRDRSTVASALKRAASVEAGSPAATSVRALLTELLDELKAQSGSELTYRKEQAEVEREFSDYVQSYIGLLKEREHHYEGSLSALKLYAAELEDHEQTQSKAATGEASLNTESDDICNSLLAMYDRRTQRRSTLREQLKAVVPQLPGILLIDSGDNQDADSSTTDA